MSHFYSAKHPIASGQENYDTVCWREHRIGQVCILPEGHNPYSQIRHVLDGELQYDALLFVCPGCKAMLPNGDGLHMLPVNDPVKTPSWTWNNSLERPTLNPSILTKWGTVVDGTEQICHSFLVDGVFDFLGDCTHPLAGQKVPMVPLEDWMMHDD